MIVEFFRCFVLFQEVSLYPSLVFFLVLDVVADDQEVLLVNVISILSFGLFVF